MRRRHSAVDEGRGGRVVARHIFPALVGIIIHVLLCGTAYAVVQACSDWVVVGVKVVQLHIPHIACGVNEAVRWVCWDGHCTPIVADKKTKGMPLARVTPSFKGVMCHLEVSLYIGHKV